MSIYTETLSPKEITTCQDQLVAIYREAFRLPPYEKGAAEVSDFIESLQNHMAYEGFRLIVASHQKKGEPVGFTYGFANKPDQFVHMEMMKVVDAEWAAAWLNQSFRLVEMAVMPVAQGQGIGSQLHNHLLREVPYKKAILATMAADTTAYRMYRNRDWKVLYDRMYFSGYPRSYRIMGLDLASYKTTSTKKCL